MEMMFVQTPTQFYVLRFLLGAFEAGFTPGVLLYLTYWYPPARRARMIAVFLLGAIAASLIAGPLSGPIMKFLNGANGWHGWPWLFLVQGLPAPLLGIMAWFILVDRPEQATWLSHEEKAGLRRQLDAESQAAGKATHGSLLWALSLAYVLVVAGTYAIVFWTPTLIKGWGVDDMLKIGVYAALPQLCAIFAVVLLGRSSDRHQERRWHFSAGALAVVAGLGIVALAGGHLVASLAGLCLAMMGIASVPPVFFAIVSEYLPRASVTAGIAPVSSIGNLGGAIAPPVTSAIDAVTGGTIHSLYFVMSLYVLASLILLPVFKRAVPALRVRAA